MELSVPVTKLTATLLLMSEKIDIMIAHAPAVDLVMETLDAENKLDVLPQRLEAMLNVD